ncbi:MAG: ABC transporter substrate-binding protein, partial [Acidobacteriota bacterium]|nr:ABC transporter substrate-binding protein [Acidobacteriota bacterium]
SKSVIEPKTPNAEKKPSEAGGKEIIEQKTKPPVKSEPKFGAEAIDDFTLKVTLLKPDKDFPALVAHPIFRPVYGDGKYFEGGKLSSDIVTSGAFRVASVAAGGITLERSENFWDKAKIEIERVRLVPMENAEKALEAYRAGELDAVTNLDFEPLALKLMTPFDDFQRTPHGALNFYEFNTNKPPFNDHRVREALAIAVERERLTEDEMDGASLPALSFSPFDDEKNTKLKQDTERARRLLEAAGFPNGANFPTIRLVVNRNNVQQRIARSVAKMWKQNLNVETEIIIKEQAEIDAAKLAGDFDVLRRGVVLPTTDEAVNMLAIFPPKIKSKEVVAKEKPVAGTNKEIVKENKKPDGANLQDNDSLSENRDGEAAAAESKTDESTASAKENENATANHEVLTEGEAIFQIPAIPLYFSTSYSLVKPYIQGFEINTLDAPSLKDVRIDNDWQPKQTKGAS